MAFLTEENVALIQAIIIAQAELMIGLILIYSRLGLKLFSNSQLLFRLPVIGH